jgi:hypothetical protein
MNVNTSKQQHTDAEIDNMIQKQAVEMKRIFAESPTMDIQLQLIEGSKAQTVEGGTNGYFWKLQRGVRINDVPQPILDSLDEAHIQYSRLTMLKPSAKMLADQKKADEAAKPKKGGKKEEQQDPPTE